MWAVARSARRAVVVLVMNVAVALGACAGRDPMQQSVWTGSFHLLWGDPRPPRPGSPRMLYELVTGSGEVLKLLVADSVLAEAGGARDLVGKRVTIAGERDSTIGAVRVRTLHVTGPAEDH
jgi:hypothetical protein